MSAGADLPPLKIESSSSDSSPHLATGRPSPKSSSCDKIMDITPSYSTLSFGLFASGNRRSSYSTCRVGFDGEEYQSTLKLPKPSNAAALSEERPQTTSPITNCLANEDSTNSPSNSLLSQRRSTSSSAEFLGKAICSEDEEFVKEKNPSDSLPIVLDVINACSKSCLDASQTSRNLLSQKPLQEQDCLQNGKSFNSTSVKSSDLIGSFDNNMDNIIDLNIDDSDEEWSDSDDDHIECADCSLIFSNLKFYMDHKCCRHNEGLLHSSLKIQLDSALTSLVDERSTTESSSFLGTIIFNQNGSVYVIDDKCTDLVFGEAFPVVPVTNEYQCSDLPESQVSTVTFFHRRSSLTVPPQSASELGFSRSKSFFHSFHAFDMGTSETKNILPLISIREHSPRLVLMCFICKLVFRKAESLLRHVECYHDVILNDDDRLLLCDRNISVISHKSGDDNPAKLLVLYPFEDLSADSTDNGESSKNSKQKLAEFIAKKGCFQTERKLPFGDFNGSWLTSHENKLRLSHNRLFISDNEVGFTCESSIGSIKPSSASLAVKNNEDFQEVRSSEASPAAILCELAAGHAIKKTPPVGTETCAPFRLKTSPSTISSTCVSLPSSSESISLVRSTASATTSSAICLPSLVLSSINPTTLSQNVNPSTETLTSLQLNGFHIPNLPCTCDDHPQGKSHDKDCLKCDSILNSSQSSVSIMAMTHSRNSCKTLKCPKCNWHYKYQETLEIHMKEKHPDSDAQCAYCLTSQIHPRLARGESYSCGYKPFRCEVCNYSTTTKGNLSIHMQSDKHINNMQDLATGNTERHVQPQQPTTSQSIPINSASQFQNTSSSHSHDDYLFNRGKQKPSYVCNICGYETSVARNLRIHMTSDKHAHKILAVTQDEPSHHRNQMNKQLGVNPQEQASRFAIAGARVSNEMIPYEESALSGPVSDISSPTCFEMQPHLTNENGYDEFDIHWASNVDAKKMFQCCICYRYGSDSVGNVQEHILFDRTKSNNTDSHKAFSNGTFYCIICSYKTNLKANFHLHCKTDKHLQKLQIVNHLREGGHENEWMLSRATSPMKICCNACSFHANSTHKIQLHLNSLQHRACSQLFRYLQLLEHAASDPDACEKRYYQCSLCDINVRTKQKVVAHAMTRHHLQKERSLQQGQMSIIDIYIIKDMTAGEHIEFEDEAYEHHIDVSDSVDTACTLASRNTTSNRSVISANNHAKVTAVAAPPTNHSSTTATSLCSSASSSIATNCMFLTTDASGGDSITVKAGGDIDNHDSEIVGLPLAVALVSRNSVSPTVTDTSATDCTELKNCAKRARSDNNTSSSNEKHWDFPICNPPSALSQVLSLPAGSKPAECILCPLCRHECTEANLLAEHLVKEHNVAQEGIKKILSMVDMPAPPSISGGSSESTLSSSSCTGSNHTDRVPPCVSSPLIASSSTSTTAESKVCQTSNRQMVPETLDPKLEDKSPHRAHKTSSMTISPTVDFHSKAYHMLSASSPSSSTTTTSSASASMSLTVSQVTCSPAYNSALSTQSLANENWRNMSLSLKDMETEINLDLLETEHTRLLTQEGIDVTLQKRMDKEFEDIFCCQTCSRSFSDIESLYSHQNELGHLELKQTPRGPGYLCWRKGCNQYFKTALTLQIHFKEIHAKKPSTRILSPQELELYKLNCGQCSFSFKTLEAMQRHTLIHLIQSVTQCRICAGRFNSVRKMERHLKIDHGDLASSDVKLHMESIETNARLLFYAPGYEPFLSKILFTNGDISSRSGIPKIQSRIYERNAMSNYIDVKGDREQSEECMDESEGRLENSQDGRFLEEYMNSPSVAEEHYQSNDRKIKCHRCKMGFTNQRYLFAHNKTSLHRHNEQIASFDSPSSPFMCEVCKESFTQKCVLLEHYNSISHLQKLNHQSTNNEDKHPLTHTSSRVLPPLLSTYPIVNSPSTIAYDSGHNDQVSVNSNGSSGNIKPYKCNICKVKYNNQPSFEIHLRSVGHKAKAIRLGELIQSGHVNVSQALIEHPDPRTANKQQAQVIADMIHQQATAQAASNAATSFFNLQSFQSINAMTQLSLIGILPTSSHQNFLPSIQNALTEVPQMDSYYPSINSQSYSDTTKLDNNQLSSSSDYSKDKLGKVSSPSLLTSMVSNADVKGDGKSDPTSNLDKAAVGMADVKSLGDGKSGRKDDYLSPYFHAPVIARPRGFMGRFKPQLYKSLLETFGFEYVMHFNEKNTRQLRDDELNEERDKENDKLGHNRSENEGVDNKELNIDATKVKDNEEGGEDDDDLQSNDTENDLRKDNVNGVINLAELRTCPKEEDDLKDNADENDAKKDEVNGVINLTELSKQKCRTCHKDFSNIWVLKNHEEDAHSLYLPPEVVDEFGQRFRTEWEKNLPKSLEKESISTPQKPIVPSTPTAVAAAEKAHTTDMPPPKLPGQPPLPSHFELTQLLPHMGMNLLPMHLSVNLLNLGLQNSLMPLLMLPTMDLSQGFLPHIHPPSVADSPTSLSSQQQFHAAALAAQNQKRVRTRISDDQLKVLRQYFDINNSPSEEQVNKMSDQTGLPQKVIKHWFRNTLFKERQRNKDSPYNFNNPPSTSIDLDEYDRTGKIPQMKLELEEEFDRVETPVPDIKRENQPAAEENCEDKSEHDNEPLDNALKIDLTTKMEISDEVKGNQESHSNTSSPFMSSIPSTPTASAPATPNPTISVNPVNSANPFAFSLDTYAANMARLETATFQSIGKRANRTRFTDYQIKTLQDYFERNAYPKDDELEHLSKILGLSARVIVVWFQNARQKARKIYENQPPNEGIKESLSPFQRTPGLNYQCKKCNSVYQRYYELIKHQKHSCVGESNNNKPGPTLIEEDSNCSYSNDDSNFSDRQTTPASGYRNKDLQIRSQPAESLFVSTPKLSRASSTPLTPSPHSTASSTNHSLTCDKCSLAFSRFDLWQEHQRLHNKASDLLVLFPSSPSFGLLQDLTHQEDNTAAFAAASPSVPHSHLSSTMSLPITTPDQASAMMTTPTSSSSLSPSSCKRKTDSEDDSGEQPKDKRLRTTILPEQLDFLYQQYQIDCNPSRKQLEHIANTVSLKKRVVQVWFQNTRARERKGHYRAHQQLINKRCPFCRALFRAKSALESHFATKHPEEMAKGDINIDLLPDAVIEPPTNHTHNSMPAFSGHVTSSSSAAQNVMSDFSKFLPSGPTAAMPNYMSYMSAAGSFNPQYPGPSSDMLSHVPFEDPYFKKYMNDLVNNMAMRQEHSMSQSHINMPVPSATSSQPSQKSHTHQSPAYSPMSRPFDAHTTKTPQQTPPSLPSNEDAPLDLSKPAKLTETGCVDTPYCAKYPTDLDFGDRSTEMDYLRRMSSMDDSISETQSEMADHEYTNDIGNSPPSPFHSNSFSHTANTPASIGKRYRTQMSAVQVKVMKNLFQDYKTPTMTECELLGQEVGLAKRVVQVWFQNARAKEKKSKLASGKPFDPETDFSKAPEDCKLCNYKYTHKVTVQDHIFTKPHIDKVKTFLNSRGDQDTDLCNSSFSSTSQSQSHLDRGVRKRWDDSISDRHIAQLQSMGLNPSAMGYPLNQEKNNLNNQEQEVQRKDKKLEGLPSKDEQKKQTQVAMEMAMNAQMLSALGGYMPGLDPAYLPYMYNELPGYFPGMGLSMMQPGLIPEHMLTYDPLAYGTPLALLQIPATAIKSVSDKVTDAGSVLARYTQDCQSLADLHRVVSAADLTVAAEATLDVGYICKKCHMVYPARDSCVAHQISVCRVSTSSLSKGFEPIMKLEQVQYECRACKERFSTILEFKSHCQQESHKHKLIKFKVREAARQEAAGSPCSSAPYASSTSKIIYSHVANSSKHLAASPCSNNNNNSSSHNNNQVSSPDNSFSLKPSLAPSQSHFCSNMSPPPSASSIFRDKNSPAFTELPDMNRLKAE